MPKRLDASQTLPWEAEGRRLALVLDDCNVALVIGDDPALAACVALGIARVQSLRRWVIVADAVGTLSPIDDLVPFEWPHGIGDAFLHGVPLQEAVHPLEGHRELRLLPSGAGKLDRTVLFASSRWTKIVEKLKKDGELLIMVAPADEPALKPALRYIDGVVLVGKAKKVSGVKILAEVRAPATPAPTGAARRRPERAAHDSPAEGSSLPPLPDFPAARPGSRPGALRRVTSVNEKPPEPEPERKTNWLFVLFFAGLFIVEMYIWYQRNFKE